MYAQQYIILCPLFFTITCSSSCIPSPEQCGCSSVKPNFIESKVVGGYTARNHSWPWMVSLRQLSNGASSTSPGSVHCGGTLINSQYVLTAAHCLKSVTTANLSKYFVVLGGLFKNDTNPVRFKIKSFTVHSQYNHETYENDIALLKLVRSVDFNDPNVGFICLPPNDKPTYPYDTMIGTAIGWGNLEQGGSLSYTLQQVQLPIISYTNKYCSNVLNNNVTQFCAGYIEGGKDTCQGDSGGPFMIYDADSDTWNIAGITSYGYGCAQAEKPGVYTRVSTFINWIDDHMRDEYFESQASIQSVSFFILLLLFCINWIP